MHLPKLEIPSVRVLLRRQSKLGRCAPADLAVDPCVGDVPAMARRQSRREPQTKADL